MPDPAAVAAAATARSGQTTTLATGAGEGDKEGSQDDTSVTETPPSSASASFSETAPQLDSSAQQEGGPSGTQPQPSTLAEFFAQPWVHAGDPEVLFIKRASHAGDRWSGHVALPGGKRDPEDESDLAAAVREAREEVGIELCPAIPTATTTTTTTNIETQSQPKGTCILAGSLPERVVAQTWGSSPLMVLCSYVFLLTSPDVPRARPQPTEVASVHWVPLRALLSPALRTREYVDTSGRMAGRYGWLARSALRMSIGRMCFSAIRLCPSESVHASEIPGFMPSRGETRLQSFLEGSFGVTPPGKKAGLAYQGELLLWGLTLGVMADFLDMLPPYNAVRLWLYPTFTVPDLRLIVWAVTRGLRKGNASDLSAGTWARDSPEVSGSSQGNPTAVDDSVVAVPDVSPITSEEEKAGHGAKKERCRKNDVGISGLGIGLHQNNGQSMQSRLLTGYYERISVAIAVFLVYRTAAVGGIGWWAWKKWANTRR